jgi:hypothetical protein
MITNFKFKTDTEEVLMKTSVIAVSVVVLAFISGCASNRNAVIKAGESIRQDVFKEVSDSTATSGKTLLKIDFPVKNYKARFINNYIKYSDPPYTVTINIDGQSVVLSNEPVLEDVPGDFMKNPEAGTGWKYNFKKELLLEPGRHHVTVAVPLSDVVIEKDVTLNAGVNQLLLIPVYNSCSLRYRNYPRFNHGLSQVAVKLNNNEL